ncbi:hypothetical protein ACH5RR_009947 [Cinchona calisaya]|uniref:DDE Tnp4 domain-containing protein n=1 Tax=Cinchona calisaya TaxID=153742 RepID=A0ABD3AI91_9GENT
MDSSSDDETAMIIGAATSALAAGYAVLEAYRTPIVIPRPPHINRDQARENYMDSILYGSSSYCIDQIRMDQDTFFRLLNTLTVRGLLHPTIHMSLREQLLMFLQIVGYNLRFRTVGGYLYRSTETISRYFSIVLDAILKLYPELVHLPNQFLDYVGAIDGTHILAAVPLEIQGKFRGRKGIPTQNVFAAISFDLKFSYVLAGWEGSAHDSRVLEDALSRPGGLQVPKDKYYLVDAGYGIRNGFIPPYIGVRYHLKEYDGNPPQNEKELFNLRHSSLRTTIERDFGILKKRFRVIDNDPFWDFKTQVDVLLACCILHNHIMGITPNDRFIQQMGRKGEKQFRWSKPMEHMMLQILAEEVKLGNRPNNNFRQSSFTRVVDAIKEKFGATCLPYHVENHLRTVRASWSTIVAIRGRSGFSWIEDLKMIIASQMTFCITNLGKLVLHYGKTASDIDDDDLIMFSFMQKNPSHDKYIHKKIDFYDEMAVVVGKDMATRSFGKTFTDINVGAPLIVDDAVNNITELVMQKEIPSSNASSSGTNTSSFGAKTTPQKKSQQ